MLLFSGVLNINMLLYDAYTIHFIYNKINGVL